MEPQTHTETSCPRPIRVGSCLSLPLIGLDHNLGLMSVCYSATERLLKLEVGFFCTLNDYFITLEKWGCIGDVTGRALEPCTFLWVSGITVILHSVDFSVIPGTQWGFNVQRYLFVCQKKFPLAANMFTDQKCGLVKDGALLHFLHSWTHFL